MLRYLINYRTFCAKVCKIVSRARVSKCCAGGCSFVGVFAAFSSKGYRIRYC